MHREHIHLRNNALYRKYCKKHRTFKTVDRVWKCGYFPRFTDEIPHTVRMRITKKRGRSEQKIRATAQRNKKYCVFLSGKTDNANGIG